MPAIIKRDSFNAPFTKEFGPAEFTKGLQIAAEHQFGEPHATTIVAILVELKRAEQKITDKDIQNIKEDFQWMMMAQHETPVRKINFLKKNLRDALYFRI